MPQERGDNFAVLERREFERIDAKFPLRLDAAEQPFGADIYLRDFSAGGVKIISKRKLVTGEDVELWVDVPDGHGPAHFSGRVVWFKDVGKNVWDAGICFRHIKLMDCRRLLNCNSTA